MTHGAGVRFADRSDAGRRLAARLGHLRDQRTVVVGLPRGGVPVAREVADALDAPLDVILVRKVGVPWHPELAMGALGEGGVRVIDAASVRRAGVSPAELAEVEARESAELDRRRARFRRDHGRVDLRGRTVVVVDDGLATGSSALAATAVVRAAGAARVVLAVPVAPAGWTERLANAADELVAVAAPAGFRGVGQFYDDFHQVSDAEVVAALTPGRDPD